jgi:hypothetical protein
MVTFMARMRKAPWRLPTWMTWTDQRAQAEKSDVAQAKTLKSREARKRRQDALK